MNDYDSSRFPFIFTSFLKSEYALMKCLNIHIQCLYVLLQHITIMLKIENSHPKVIPLHCINKTWDVMENKNSNKMGAVSIKYYFA